MLPPKRLRCEVAPGLWVDLPVVRAIRLADGKTWEVLVDASSDDEPDLQYVEVEFR